MLAWPNGARLLGLMMYVISVRSVWVSVHNCRSFSKFVSKAGFFQCNIEFVCIFLQLLYIPKISLTIYSTVNRENFIMERVDV